MKPFLLAPAYKDYVWGGSKLKKEYGKLTELGIIAESWELSARPEGSSTIAGGELAGMPFSEFVKAYPQIPDPGRDGSAYPQIPDPVRDGSAFPILVKLIDARAPLSVQVHPDDDYALRLENSLGKTEMWIILDCDPGAFLYHGLNKRISKDELRGRIDDNTLTDCLRKLYVKKGDAVFVHAGVIHSIGAGIVLAEIQQNSDSTYRVYDFGRLGADGHPRQLHIGKALDVAALRPADPSPPGALPTVAGDRVSTTRVCACEYFTVDRIEPAGGSHSEAARGSFAHLLCVDGNGLLSCSGDEIALGKGASLYIPSDAGDFTLSGDGGFLLTRGPALAQKFLNIPLLFRPSEA